MFSQVALSVICMIFVLASCEKPLITQEWVDAINARQDSWVASMNGPFVNKTKAEIRKMAGVLDRPEDLDLWKRIPESDIEVITKPPEAFDAREQWPNCCVGLHNMGKCNSAWAFASTEALAQRYCIATGGKKNFNLSAQQVLSCEAGECSLGYNSWAWEYMEKTGAPDDDCVPYTSFNGDPGICQTQCADGTNLVLYQSQKMKKFMSLEKAQVEIMTNGPITGTIDIYDEFYSYSSGIYTCDSSDDPDGYAPVKLLGWGKNSKKNPYLIGSNSWGEQWGMDGYFWIDPYGCEVQAFMMSGDVPSQEEIEFMTNA